MPDIDSKFCKYPKNYETHTAYRSYLPSLCGKFIGASVVESDLEWTPGDTFIIRDPTQYNEHHLFNDRGNLVKFIKRIKNGATPHWELHEGIPEYVPQKIKLDLDISRTELKKIDFRKFYENPTDEKYFDDDNHVEIIEHAVVKALKNTLIKDYGVNPDRAECIIQTAHGISYKKKDTGYKWSYHIIPRYVYCENVEHVKEVYSRFINRIDDVFRPVIDDAINKKGIQYFRMCGSSKIDVVKEHGYTEYDRRPFVLPNGIEYEETLITNINGCLKLNATTPVLKESKKGLKNITQVVQSILENLDKDRWYDSKKWKSLMWGIKNIGRNYDVVDQMYDLFDTFSQSQPDVYDVVNNKKQWAGCGYDDVTLGFLWNLLKKDSPSMFNKLRKQYATNNALTFDEYAEMLKGKKLTLNEIRNNIVERGETGLAEIFSKLSEGKLYISDMDGSGYVWGDVAKLWEKKTKKQIMLNLTKVMEPLFNHVKQWAYNNIEKIEKIDPLIAGVPQERKTKDIDKKTAKDKTTLKMLKRQSHKIFDSGGINSVWTLCTSILYDDKIEDKMNSSAHELPVRGGGVLNFETQKIRPRTPKDFWDFESVATLTDDREYPIVQRFVEQLMLFDEEKINYLQKTLGYCSTGWTHFKAFNIYYGGGDNAKGTMDGLMRKVLGSLFTSLSRDVMLSNTNKSSEGSASPHLIALKGKRYGVYTESEEGEQINSAMVKRVTGNGDVISCRELHKNQTEFIPFIKIAMETNHLPTLNINDRAIVSRCRYIPFLARFSPDPSEVDNKSIFLADQSKKNELMNNLDQWLTFLADGAYMCHNDGHLNLPQVLLDARDSYIDGQDSVAMFLKDKCELKAGERAGGRALYEAYTDYAKENIDRDNVLSHTKFGKRVSKKLNKKRDANGVYYEGVKIIEVVYAI